MQRVSFAAPTLKGFPYSTLKGNPDMQTFVGMIAFCLSADSGSRPTNVRTATMKWSDDMKTTDLKTAARISVPLVAGLVLTCLALRSQVDEYEREVPRKKPGPAKPDVVSHGVGGFITGSVNFEGIRPNGKMADHVAVDPRIEIAADAEMKGAERLSQLIAINASGERIAYREDLDLVLNVLLNRNEDDTIRHESANLLIRHDYPGLAKTFEGIVMDKGDNPRFRSFAVQYLWRIASSTNEADRREIAACLRTSLLDGPLPVRREALLALSRGGDADARAYAVGLLRDGVAGDGMRDLAVRVIREASMRGHIESIRSLVSSTDEAEQIAALVTLGKWEDREARPAIEAACKSQNERVSRAATAALAAINGAATVAKSKDGASPSVNGRRL